MSPSLHLVAQKVDHADSWYPTVKSQTGLISIIPQLVAHLLLGAGACPHSKGKKHQIYFFNKTKPQTNSKGFESNCFIGNSSSLLYLITNNQIKINK